MSNPVKDANVSMSLGGQQHPSDYPVEEIAPSPSDLAELPTEGFTLANDNKYRNYLQLPDIYFQPHRAWQYVGLTGGVRIGSYTLPADQVGIDQDFVFEGLEYRVGPSGTLPLGLKGPALFGEVVVYGTGPQSYKHGAWIQTPVDDNPDMGMPGDEAPEVPEIESYSSPTTHLDRFGIGWAVGFDLIPPNALGVPSWFDVRLAYEGTHSTPNHASEDPSWPTAALPFTADGVGQTTPAELLDITSHALRLDAGTGFLQFTGSIGLWNTTRHNPEDTGGTGQYVTIEDSTLQASEVTDDTSVLHGNFWTAGVTANLSGIAMPRLKSNWGTDDYVGIYLDGDKDGTGAQYVDALHADQTGPLFFVRESRYQKLREQVVKDHPTDVAAQYSQLQAALIKEAQHQYPKVNVLSVESDVYAAILGSEKLPKSANVQVLYDLYLQDPAGFAEARESYIQSCKEAEDAVRAKVNAKLERQGKATNDDDAKKARIAAVKAYANKHNDRAGYLILIPRDRLADARGGTFWLTTDATDCDDQNTDPENDCRPAVRYYQDLDGDGFGNPDESQVARAPITGYVTDKTDCDDTDDTVGNVCGTYYPDADSDTYGNPAGPTKKGAAEGYVLNNTDCDDSNATIHPGAADPQLDCDPSNDDVDTDGDGLGDKLEDRIGTDKTKADTDGDGLSDRFEVLGTKTSGITENGILLDEAVTPYELLRTGEKFGDKTDASAVYLHSNPLDVDTDGDGINDRLELTLRSAALSFNPRSSDSDGDTIGDGIEGSADAKKMALGTYTAVDTDEDGTPDGLDANSDDDAYTDIEESHKKDSTLGVITQYSDLKMAGSGSEAGPAFRASKVRLTDDGIQIADQVHFDTGKATIKADSFDLLNQVAAVINANPSIIIEIQGHTDRQGSDASNQTLSENRAKAIFTYLTTRATPKVDPARLQTVGYGESRPIENPEEDGFKSEANRRVEFVRVGSEAHKYEKKPLTAKSFAQKLGTVVQEAIKKNPHDLQLGIGTTVVYVEAIYTVTLAGIVNLELTMKVDGPDGTAIDYDNRTIPGDITEVLAKYTVVNARTGFFSKSAGTVSITKTE